MVETMMLEGKSPKYSSLRDYFYVVFRHKGKALLFFLVVFVAAIVVVSMMEDQFRSEAKLLVRPGWESVTVDPAATLGERAGGVNQPQTVVLNTVLNIIKDQSLAGEVVDRIGPLAFLEPFTYKKEPGVSGTDKEDGSAIDSVLGGVKDAFRSVKDTTFFGGSADDREPLSERDQAIRILMNNTEAQLVRNTHLISIAYTALVPQLAQDVVKELTKSYFEKHQLPYRNPGGYKFIQDRYNQARADMELFRKEMNNLKKDNDVVSIEKRLEFIDTQAGTLENQYNQARSDLSVTQAKIDDLEKELPKLPERVETSMTSTPDYTTINTLRTRLLELQALEQEALAKFTDDSEPVAQVRRQIAAVQEQLDNEEPGIIPQVTEAVNTVRQQLETNLFAEKANLSSHQATTEELKKQLTVAVAERQKLIALQYEFNELQRDLDEAETNYRTYSAKLDQVETERQLADKGLFNVETVSPATNPLEPEESKKMIILLGGFFGGICGGIFLTFVFASMDHTLKTPEEVEDKLGLPALVAIPQVRANKFSLKTRLKGRRNVSA